MKTSNYVGVRKDGSKYRAEIQVNGTKMHLGMFQNEHEAAEAYDKEAAKLGRITNTKLGKFPTGTVKQLANTIQKVKDNTTMIASAWSVSVPVDMTISYHKKFFVYDSLLSATKDAIKAYAAKKYEFTAWDITNEIRRRIALGTFLVGELPLMIGNTYLQEISHEDVKKHVHYLMTSHYVTGYKKVDNYKFFKYVPV